MCMKYKGTEYHFAFEFRGLYKDEDRVFRIVISNFREESQDYAGLCLDNEFKVVSAETDPAKAYYEIIDKTVNITFSSEELYRESHPGESVSPVMKVTDDEFLNKFEDHKKSQRSLEYYEKLSDLFEQSEIKLNEINDIKPSQFDLYDCRTFAALFILLQLSSHQIKVNDVYCWRL